MTKRPEPGLGINRDDGTVLNARFNVEESAVPPTGRAVHELDVILYSRHRYARKDYNPALELLIDRLRSLGGVISAVWVDTQSTRKNRIPNSDCLINVRDRRYPIDLNLEPDSRALRLAITANIGKAGLVPGREGGHTPLKQLRIRLLLEVKKSSSELAKSLAGPEGNRPNTVAVDISEPPKRKATTVSRIIRDTAIVHRLKVLHDDRCQVCGLRLEVGEGEAYSEGHHLRPLGSPHDGPDAEDNILILCPNCHAKLDFRGYALNIENLTLRQGHRVAEEHVQYHNDQVAGG